MKIILYLEKNYTLFGNLSVATLAYFTSPSLLHSDSGLCALNSKNARRSSRKFALKPREKLMYSIERSGRYESFRYIYCNLRS